MLLSHPTCTPLLPCQHLEYESIGGGWAGELEAESVLTVLSWATMALFSPVRQ